MMGTCRSSDHCCIGSEIESLPKTKFRGLPKLDPYSPHSPGTLDIISYYSSFDEFPDTGSTYSQISQIFIDTKSSYAMQIFIAHICSIYFTLLRSLPWMPRSLPRHQCFCCDHLQTHRHPSYGFYPDSTYLAKFHKFRFHEIHEMISSFDIISSHFLCFVLMETKVHFV